LDNEWRTREDRIQHDPKSVPIQTIDSESRRTVENEKSGGRVGAEAQAMTPRSLATTQSSGPSEEESDTETQTINAISSTRTAKEVWGMTPKRVTVALYVPSSYFEQVWHKQNPPDPDASPDAKPEQPDPAALVQIRDQELTDIESQVAMILPDVEGVQDKSELVNAAVYPDIKPEQPPKPGIVSHAAGWLGQHWSTLGLIGLVVGSLLMLRGMLRATASGETTAGVPLAAMADPGREESATEESPAERRLRRFEGGGMSLQEELSDLVNEDPDAAVNILRTWIGSAT
jgi:flagellar M-ring protein FliF